MWIAQYVRGDRVATQFLDAVYHASRPVESRFTPLDEYPDPGMPHIEEITNPWIRERLGLEELPSQGPPQGYRPAIEYGPLALEGSDRKGRH